MNKYAINFGFFHDSTVKNIDFDGDIAIIKIEDVNIGDIDHEDHPHSFLVTIKNIKKILRNDELVVSISSEAEDGEIILLKQNNDAVSFTVQWENFSPRSSETVTYEFVGGIMSCELIS